MNHGKTENSETWTTGGTLLGALRGGGLLGHWSLFVCLFQCKHPSFGSSTSIWIWGGGLIWAWTKQEDWTFIRGGLPSQHLAKRTQCVWNVPSGPLGPTEEIIFPLFYSYQRQMWMECSAQHPWGGLGFDKGHENTMI